MLKQLPMCKITLNSCVDFIQELIKKLISTENEEIADTYMVKTVKLKYKYCNYKHKQKSEKYSGELCKTCRKKNHFKRNV